MARKGERTRNDARHENPPIVWCDGLSVSGSDEGGLVSWEVLEEQGGQVSILSEMQQVLQTVKGEQSEGQPQEQLGTTEEGRALTATCRRGSQSSRG